MTNDVTMLVSQLSRILADLQVSLDSGAPVPQLMDRTAESGYPEVARQFCSSSSAYTPPYVVWSVTVESNSSYDQDVAD
ncbi:hypothetical protein LLF88_06865 [bacterium]|nr:hypothetical protein [bacterium]